MPTQETIIDKDHRKTFQAVMNKLPLRTLLDLQIAIAFDDDVAKNKILGTVFTDADFPQSSIANQRDKILAATGEVAQCVDFNQLLLTTAAV